MKKIPIFATFCVLILLNLTSCKQTENDPISGKKKRFEPNVKERINESDSGIFLGGKGGSSGTFDFATSNPLWRASLKVIEFMPLASASYSGGVITTDWYSGNLNSTDEIKITIRFLSDELNINSVNVATYKKICSTNMNCKVSAGSKEISRQIKEKIILEARKISLEESKKKK